MQIAAIVLLLAVSVQDPAKPKFKTEFKLTIENAGGLWSFWIEGTTGLPVGALLKGRLFAVEEVDDFKGGKRPDEESLISEDRGWRRIRVAGPKFREKLLTSPRKPYSIWYRARLTYDPDIQDDAILNKVGEQQIPWDADLHYGGAKEFERELAATLKDLTREMEEVQSLYRDLRGRFQIWTRAPDAAAFAEWRKGLAAKVEVIRKNNDTRYSIWIVWLERQAKFRFDSFADRLDGLCAEFEEWLEERKKVAELSKDPKKNATEIKEATEHEQDHQLRIMYGLTGFLAYFEEARDALGIDTPSDPDVVGAILKEYESAMAELATLASKGDAAQWKEKAPAVRARARKALMQFSAPGLLPRRAYDRVLELADKFAAMYVLFEKTAAGEKPAPGEIASDHASVVAEFRKYAGAN